MNVLAEFCTNGKQAVKAVEKRAKNPKMSMYKLILMDYSMPILTGPEATRQIRSILSQKGYTDDDPIICLVTSYQERSK